MCSHAHRERERLTRFRMACSASCPFFEDLFFNSSSRRCLSILLKNIGKIQQGNNITGHVKYTVFLHCSSLSSWIFKIIIASSKFTKKLKHWPPIPKNVARSKLFLWTIASMLKERSLRMKNNQDICRRQDESQGLMHQIDKKKINTYQKMLHSRTCQALRYQVSSLWIYATSQGHFLFSYFSRHHLSIADDNRTCWVGLSQRFFNNKQIRNGVNRVNM